ncbi:hypothetical protein RN001_015515 [Aquatica leii]|uniref:Ionotropic glutamate receptor C-terminal domain-containing protein n=1 Tax=Aquatica leii TaxID=1421715 RepID=A0AAN7P3I4_9COLE|nr:hypothetical protein RN001_015515 [Aquatica leii]
MKIKIQLLLTITFFAALTCLKQTTKDVGFVQCLKRIAKYNLEMEKTVYYVYDTDIAEFELVDENPYVTVNVNKVIVCETYTGAINFILKVQSSDSLLTTLKSFKSSRAWDQRYTPKGRFIIVTPEKNITKLFQVLWSFLIIKSVLLIHDNKSNPKVYTCNPYVYENRCGDYVKEYNSQPCTENTTLQIEKISTNFNKCNVSILLHNAIVTMGSAPPYYSFFISMINDGLNITIQSPQDFSNHVQPPKLGLLPVIMKHIKYEETKKYYSKNVIWLVPFPKILSPFDALVSVYATDTWILIITFFVFTIIFWWVTKIFPEKNGYFEKFCFVLTQMASATLNASVNRLPQTTSVRILVVSYIIYIIHIQSIYTSNLIRIFTKPLYEHAIENLEDLAYSELPIFAYRVYEHEFKKSTIFEKNLSHIILSKLVYLNKEVEDIEQIARYKNCAVVTYEERLPMYNKNLLSKIRKIVDNRMTDRVEEHFMFIKGHFFIDVINRLITIGVESGMADKATEKMKISISQILDDNKVMNESDPVVLTIEHVYVVFVLWSVGMIIHKYYCISF